MLKTKMLRLVLVALAAALEASSDDDPVVAQARRQQCPDTTIPMPCPDRTTPIFALHIPKTGGRSLWTLAERASGQALCEWAPMRFAHYKQSLPIQREIGDRNGEGVVLSSLGGADGTAQKPTDAHGILNSHHATLHQCWSALLVSRGKNDGPGATLRSAHPSDRNPDQLC